MGRTKLRAIEVAGIRMGIEVPPGYGWRWPRGPLAEFEVAAHSVDVHVGVRIGLARGIDAGEEAWSFRHGDSLLELARLSDGWRVVVHGRRRCERVAVFDAGFRNGEVIVHPELAATGACPLEDPIGALVWMHGLVGAGGLIVSGRVRQRDGRATLLLPMTESQDRSGSKDALERGLHPRVALRLDGDDGVRAFDTPWCLDAIDGDHRVARIDSIHMLEHALEPYIETADAEEAAERLLAHAFAPMHDARLAERILSTAGRIASRSAIRIVGLPSIGADTPLDFAAPWHARPFAPPRWV